MDLKTVSYVAPTTLARFLKNNKVPITKVDAKNKIIRLAEGYMVVLDGGFAHLLKPNVKGNDNSGSLNIEEIGKFKTGEDLLKAILQLDLPDKDFINRQKQQKFVELISEAADLLPEEDYGEPEFLSAVYNEVGSDQMRDLKDFFQMACDVDFRCPK